MGLRKHKNVPQKVYCDIQRNHLLAIAAGLSYYFLLSLFPLLIFASALLAYLPVPNLFDQILQIMARVVPHDAMGLVRTTLDTVLSSPHSGLLSFGALGTLWVATGGFAALIEAMNIAYDVVETRAYLAVRGLALLLAFFVGALSVVALAVTLAGPRFGEFIIRHAHLDPIWIAAWPYMRWLILFSSVVVAIEIIYFVAPNVKQHFSCTLPGAIFATFSWVGASLVLGIYIRDYAHYNRTYGALGGAIALMLWFYVSAIAILVGGEINSELLKAAGSRLPVKEKTAEIKTQGDLPVGEREVLQEKLDEADAA